MIKTLVQQAFTIKILYKQWTKFNMLYCFYGILVVLLMVSGAIAQLGERYDGIVEVGGSIPPGSTLILSEKITFCVELNTNKFFYTTIKQIFLEKG